MVPRLGPRDIPAHSPLFYGLILGQFVAGGFWLIVDYFTGMMGVGYATVANPGHSTRGAG